MVSSLTECIHASTVGTRNRPAHKPQRLRDQGFSVVEEYAIGGGKTVDLRATRDRRGILIEVETSRSDAAANITKCAGADDEIVFVFTDVSVRYRYAESIHAALPHALVLTTAELRELR